MSKTIAITGATGFVGNSVARHAAEIHFTIRALARNADNPRALPSGAKIASGDLFDPTALDRAVEGCDAVVHLVGIIAEQPSKGVTFQHVHVDGTRAILQAVKRAGVRRYVHMSANGTRPNAVSEYHRTKWAAEELVRGSGLDWTILRPSLIHGPGGDFTQMEAAWAKGKKAPFAAMPYFGRGWLGLGGSSRVAPVYVEDVARAFVEAIANEKAIGQTYELVGSETMDWPHMHRLFAAAVTGKPSRATLPIPAWYAKAITHVVPASLLPFNKAQVQMSEEDNVADTSSFTRDFGWTPRGLSETLTNYANALRK